MYRYIFPTNSISKLAARLLACVLVCQVLLGGFENRVSGQSTAAKRAEIYYGSVRVDGPDHVQSTRVAGQSADEVVPLHLTPPLPLSEPSLANFAGPGEDSLGSQGTRLSQPRLIPSVAENETSDLHLFLNQLRNPSRPSPLSAEGPPAATSFDFEDRNQTPSTLRLSSLDMPLDSFESDNLRLPLAARAFERDHTARDSLPSGAVATDSQSELPRESKPVAESHDRPPVDSTGTQSMTSWLATQPLLHFTLGVVVSLISVCTTVSVLLRHWTSGQNAVFRVEMVNGDAPRGVAPHEPQRDETPKQPLVQPRRAAEFSELPAQSGAMLELGETFAEKQAKKQEQENQREAAIVQSLFEQNQQWRGSSEAVELSN